MDQLSGSLGVSARTAHRRMRERGSHDRAVIDAILDEGLVCHVGFVEDGSVFVEPTTYVRVDDDLYLHGAPANRMLKALASGTPACITVTLLDGIVLARSAFHHSMNYRSVMLFGEASAVHDEEAKRAAVHALVEHIVPGRTADTRPPSTSELRATLVVRVPIAEGSAKIRTGGPLEEPADLELAIWAGQIPLEVTAAAPEADARFAAGVGTPRYVTHYTRHRAGAGGDAVSPPAGP